MKASIEVSGDIIVRRFVGDVSQADLIKSWREVFARYSDLSHYKGMVIDLLNARLMQDRKKFREMIDFLKGKLDQLGEIKVAVLMDTPQVTQVILMDHMIKQLQIRPFATMKGAMDWINI